MKAVVTGPIAKFPVGGVVWDYGQYLLGLERLGFEVYYLEDTGTWMYDPIQDKWVEDSAYGVEYLERSLAMLVPSAVDRWHVKTISGTSRGMPAREMREVVENADLFLNISGTCLLRNEYMASPRKVLIDTDPGWNQLIGFPRYEERLTQGTASYRNHDYFLTYALRLGDPSCPIPDLGLEWHHTRPPVVLDAWSPARSTGRWTTVMSWTASNNTEGLSAEVIRHDMRATGKNRSFARIEELPTRVDAELEIAVAGLPPHHVERFEDLGWSYIKGSQVSRTAEDYKKYIEASRGEFSVAKNVYVDTRSGWFSCRSVCYLAASRPVVVQDTGFSDVIPTGDGLLAFSDLDEAVSAIERVEENYEYHAQAARKVAEEVFDSDLVITEILDHVGLT